MDDKHLAILRQGVDSWNQWKKGKPQVKPDLQRSDLSQANLLEADFGDTNLFGADLSNADLAGAYLMNANLCNANLRCANLYHAYLNGANLASADLEGADLCGADLTDVIGLTRYQLRSALTDSETKLPAYLTLDPRD